MGRYRTRKDRRKKKTGGKSVSHSCRNNGTCGWCTSNRTYKNRKREEAAKAKYKEPEPASVLLLKGYWMMGLPVGSNLIDDAAKHIEYFEGYKCDLPTRSNQTD